MAADVPSVPSLDNFEMVPVDQLTEHPRNPRRGHEGVIEALMARHGWWGVATAQRSTGHLLVGNHRVRVARRLGIVAVPVEWRDVDDDEALRILAGDNRSSDLALVEKDPAYADVICRRWQAHTGEIPVLEGGGPVDFGAGW